MATLHPWLPNPPDFNIDVLAVVEAEWLVYADKEKLTSRWVNAPSIGGNKRVQLQRDDGRSSKYYPNYENGHPSGYIPLYAMSGQPSMLILTVEDMAEAVYRHYLARDAEENAQKIFCRRFRAKFEGTREEDLNWIIAKIKLRTKEAAQGVLPTTTTFATLSNPLAPVNHAASTSPSQIRRTAPTPAPRQTISAITPIRASQTTPLQSRGTALTYTTTPQHAVSQFASRALQTTPFKGRRTTSTSTPPRTTVTPARNVPSSVYTTGHRAISTSAPARTTITPARNASGPAHGNESPPSGSRKRGQTDSMDFSERLSSRPRITDSPEWSSFDVTPTPATRLTPAQLKSANRSVSSTLTPHRSSATSSYTGSRRVTNTDMDSPSRFSEIVRTGSRPEAALSSMSGGQQHTSERRGTSNNLNTASKERHGTEPLGYLGTARRPEDHKEYSGSSLLRAAKTTGQGNAVHKAVLTGDCGKTIKGEPGVSDKLMGHSKSSGTKQYHRDATEHSGELSTKIIKGLNSQAVGSTGLKASRAHGLSKVRMQQAVSSSLTGSPKKVNKGSNKVEDNTTHSRGYPIQVDKPFNKGRGHAVGSPTNIDEGYEGSTSKHEDPFMTTAGRLKIGSGVRNGSGPPGFSISKDGKAPFIPKGPRSGLAKGPYSRPGGFSTPGSGPRGVSSSAVHPGLHFKKRQQSDKRYEKKPVDSTAHLYTSSREPEKYSEEWQARQLGLGVSFGSKGYEDQSSSAASKTSEVEPSSFKSGQLSASASKTPAAAPKAFVGAMQAILGWQPGKVVTDGGSASGTPTSNVSTSGSGIGSKPVAMTNIDGRPTLSAPKRSVSTSGGDMGSGPKIGMDLGASNLTVSGSAASNTNFTKTPSTGPSEYKGSGVANRNGAGSAGDSDSNARDTPSKRFGEGESTAMVSKAPLTGPRNPTGSSYPGGMAGGDTPTKTPPTGPRNASGSSHFGGAPTKAPGAWKNSAAPPSGGKGSRPRSPLGGGDCYRPSYADSDSPRRGRYDDGRSDRRSPPRCDYRSRFNCDDRHNGSRYRN